MRASLEERFWRKVHKSDGCWEWLGAKNPKGYGNIRPGGKARVIPATHASWMIHYGAVPDGLQINHHCDNPGCVRPDHLYAGTQSENLRDRRQRDRVNSANGRKTHCPKGHPYEGYNLILRTKMSSAGNPSAGRACRACNNEASRRYQQRKKAFVA